MHEFQINYIIVNWSSLNSKVTDLIYYFTFMKPITMFISIPSASFLSPTHENTHQTIIYKNVFVEQLPHGK